MTENVTKLQRLVIFRTGEHRADSLYKELRDGRLRQGWGRPGMSLKVSKKEWEKNYKKAWGKSPTIKRYSVLTPLLKIEEGDVVVMPKMPAARQFSIARVAGDYQFQGTESMYKEFGHIIPIVPDSVRTFHYRASDDAYTVSGLFQSAKHRPPVTFAYDKNHIDAAIRLLLKSKDCLKPKKQNELIQAALDDAVMKAAQTMKEEIKSWNGRQFENAVKTAFRNQGYEIVREYQRYDGEGADVDLVVRPPSNNYSLFMPQEIAVQVKWKQGIDQGDTKAVDQLIQWQESEAVQKFVISSADEFTEKCRKKAEEEDVRLIGGLNTMYFLMGLPNPIRDN